MSFIQDVRSGIRSFHRVMLRFTFWLGIVMVAIVLLKIWFLPQVPTMQYSELIQQVDRNNVRNAAFEISRDSVEVLVELREPQEQFKTTVATGKTEDLTNRFSQKGVPTTTAEVLARDSLAFYVAIAFVVLFFALWFFVMKLKIRQAERK
jgi:ATP-dependent Zn protease